MHCKRDGCDNEANPPGLYCSKCEYEILHGYNRFTGLASPEAGKQVDPGLEKQKKKR